MNQITQQQIKDALIEVADFFGRPHYEVSVVKDVINSFQMNIDHPLKELVVREVSLASPIEFKQIPEKVVKPKKVKTTSNEVKKSILALAQHGTITKFKSGCRCEECVAWA